MPPNRFESEVESFLEGSHGDRTHIKRADHPRLHHYAGHYLRLLGELFAEMPLKGLCWAIFSRQSALRPGLVGDVAHEAGCGGGFAALEAGWRRVAGVSDL